MNDELLEDLLTTFVVKDYRWKIGNERLVPELEDIKKVLDKAVELLRQEPDWTQIELARMIIKKKPGDIYDVYLHMGEYK